MSYGHPTDVVLSKYKWRGFKKVLLEELYPSPDKNGNIDPNPSSYTLKSYPGGKKKEIKKLPEEYARLFMGKYISF